VTTLGAILRSVWTRILLVAIVVLLVVLKLGALWRDAERGRAAAEQLADEREKDLLIKEHFLAAERERVEALEQHRDQLLAVEGDLQGELERFRKVAGGGQTVAVLDLHSGTVVADGPPPSAIPSGQGGATAGSSGVQGHMSTASAALPCSVSKGDPLEFDAPGYVERAPNGNDVYVLKLRVRNTANGWAAAGLVNPDLSHVWTLPPPPPPELARPSGWMVTALYGRAFGAGRGRQTFEGVVHTPAWRLPLIGAPARAAAGATVAERPDRKGVDFAAAVGLSIELTRWTR
jgi:hypothetical protein